MGCGSCGSGKGDELPKGCKNNGACASGSGKMDVYDWMSNVFYTTAEQEIHQFVEVKFKGTRKEYYRNARRLPLEPGDMVAVESASSGYDIGRVSVRGEVAELQMRKNRIAPDSPTVREILRTAADNDILKYEEAKALEQTTMSRARILARNLGLVMKISDVEYQGDRTKATFFYTADGRVDFRELIKVMAREFRVKVEMRQIGLRQEAGRLGGIGSCGRELCCSTWLTDFHSVSTSAARYQNLFLNPLKLSGQCGRLKCCLNYELDTYVEALADFPPENTVLQTAKGNLKADKFDILKKIIWFKYLGEPMPKYLPIAIEEVNRLMDMNRRGIVIEDAEEFAFEEEVKGEQELDFKNSAGEDSIDRFLKKGQRSKSKKKKNAPQREAKENRAGAPKEQRETSGKTNAQAAPARDNNRPHPHAGKKDNRARNERNERAEQRNRPGNGGEKTARGERSSKPEQGEATRQRQGNRPANNEKKREGQNRENSGAPQTAANGRSPKRNDRRRDNRRPQGGESRPNAQQANSANRDKNENAGA